MRVREPMRVSATAVRTGAISDSSPTVAAAPVGRIGYGMRLSRHAKNEMRLYRIAAADVELTTRRPTARELDAGGNARLAGETLDGRPILVVVAGDDPDFVITVFLRT